MQGNPDIDVLMIPTNKAIKKHVKDRDAFTEIYNRAYEAVMISMEAKEAERNKLAEAVGLMTTLKPTMVVDSAHPVEMALEVSEYITQLTAERDELKLAVAQTELDISAWKNICTEWYKDAERLAKEFIWVDGEYGEWHCIHCDQYATSAQREIQHYDNCPITLHRELCEKYEVME